MVVWTMDKNKANPNLPPTIGQLIDSAQVSTINDMEMAFRRGAHHAVTRLAEALVSVKSVDECRRLADVFSDLIGDVRLSGKEFDLNNLIAKAKM